MLTCATIYRLCYRVLLCKCILLLGSFPYQNVGSPFLDLLWLSEYFQYPRSQRLRCLMKQNVISDIAQCLKEVKIWADKYQDNNLKFVFAQSSDACDVYVLSD